MGTDLTLYEMTKRDYQKMMKSMKKNIPKGKIYSDPDHTPKKEILSTRLFDIKILKCGECIDDNWYLISSSDANDIVDECSREGSDDSDDRSECSREGSDYRSESSEEGSESDDNKRIFEVSDKCIYLVNVC